MSRPPRPPLLVKYRDTVALWDTRRDSMDDRKSHDAIVGHELLVVATVPHNRYPRTIQPLVCVLHQRGASGVCHCKSPVLHVQPEQRIQPASYPLLNTAPLEHARLPPGLRHSRVRHQSPVPANPGGLTNEQESQIALLDTVLHERWLPDAIV